ncbi:secretin and TonB N-terminal domain-containing protein [bacterium]|nr:secretin and TonB N-terminal domain-containing protein [bacterium]
MNDALKRILSALTLLFLLGHKSVALGQLVALEKMELVNMGNAYRLFIHCTAETKHTSQLANGDLRLEIYFYETLLKIKKDNLSYKNTPVKNIVASQWQASPPIVRVVFEFNLPLDYGISQPIAGLFYVDLTEKGALGSSEGADGDLVINFGDQRGGNGTDRLQRTSAPRSQKVPAKAFLESKLVEGAGHGPLPNSLANSERISLEAKNASITDVLRLLAKQTGLNIVAIEDTGKVTVNLENVSIKQALDLIAKANGYDYVINGDVVLVKPWEKFQLGELQTKVYRLKYVDAQNLRSVISQALSPQAKIQAFFNDFQAVNSASGEAAEGEENNSSARRSSTLLVTDTPLNLKKLDAMIAALDVPTPQIMIEAKLIEISPQTEEKLGIDWAKTVNAEIFQQVILPGGTQHRYSAEIPLDGGSLNFGTLNLGQYNAALDFLNLNTNAKLVSNPRILAMDNQTSVISVGQNIPIPQISRGTSGQGDIVSFQYRDFNISLEVTPHVAEGDMMSLKVNPTVEEIVGEVVVGESRAPITSIREVETVVNLRSEETMVIGGLIKESTVETTSKVWLLGDIPLVGNLFRHKSKTKRQTDLLIFITPRLL